MIISLYDSCFPQLLAQLLVLSDEALDKDVLFANTPTLVYDDGNQYQYHNNHGGGQCYCKNKCYIHKTNLRFDNLRFTIWIVLQK